MGVVYKAYYPVKLGVPCVNTIRLMWKRQCSGTLASLTLTALPNRSARRWIWLTHPNIVVVIRRPAKKTASTKSPWSWWREKSSCAARCGHAVPLRVAAHHGAYLQPLHSPMNETSSTATSAGEPDLTADDTVKVPDLRHGKNPQLGTVQQTRISWGSYATCRRNK